MASNSFKKVDSSASFPEIEKSTSKYWQENDIFQKSVDSRPKDKRWVLLDGPPFITGLPHYGSLLPSIVKDMYPRYKTMQGYRVDRVWGWDCHGLPAENKVETKLGLTDKKEIEEKVGIKKFIEECKLYVSETSEEWEWYIDRIGRWVDLKNAYRTMDTEYMESVMWIFKKMHSAGHIYKGLRVSLYCPHCQTPISNFEVAMDTEENYKDVVEPATTYKYKIQGKDEYLLAWSTTPWNKIATPALAINPKLVYAKVKQNGEVYILAEETLGMLNGKHEIVETLKGSELVGTHFEPHYDYYKNEVEKGKKVFEVVGADFVSAEEGTGVVTLAAYGEEDMQVMQDQNIHMQMHVEDNGHIKSNVPVFGGMYYLKANKQVDADLKERGLIYKIEDHSHRVPHCWRCATRLFHNPQDAWFVNVQDLKPKLVELNKKVNWTPKHFKEGRFKKSVEAAPDWNISRSRYWGSPVPVWECDCGENYVPGSIAELEKESGQKVKDLHKPEIDEITVECKKCGKDVRRVPEVLDSWIEAGSASFAERHFPFEKGMDEDDPSSFFPPDFVAEYTGQIRAWFYVMHVLGAALYGDIAFKNVNVTGVIQGTDGRKMSKNYGNYPDPKEMLNTHGGDALRIYFMGSTLMKGEDLSISEDSYKESVRGFLIPMWNVYNFFVTYANTDAWTPSTKADISSSNVLDKWALGVLSQLIKDVTKANDSFDSPKAVALLQNFLVNDFSGWYVRRSRSRFGPASTDKKDQKMGYETYYVLLTTFCKLTAPLAPFISEEIYRNLTGKESVHLENWPKAEKLVDANLSAEMKIIREVAEVAHAKRSEEGIAVKQPLQSIKVTSKSKKPQESILAVLKDELNVLNIKWSTGGEESVELDTSVTPELTAMREAREAVRSIQQQRKDLGTDLDEKIDVALPSWPEAHEDEIKAKALIRNLTKGEFSVKRI